MKTRKTTTPSHQPAFEPLENRQLMSASLWGSTLYVDGSNFNDRIEVTKSVGPLFTTINVVENFVLTGSFNAASVASINVYGYDGNDTIALGNGISAYVSGGNGGDALYGADGNDYLTGGFGNDYISGGYGNDTVDGSYDQDTVVGGPGHDSVYGGPGYDYLYGQDGNDYMNGGSEGDVMYGGWGADSMRGGTGNDELFGDADNDYLYGDDGEDILHGNAGNDCFYGGNGNDYFDAKDGVSEYIDGGLGWDTAFVDDRDWYEPWSAHDTRVSIENAFE